MEPEQSYREVCIQVSSQTLIITPFKVFFKTLFIHFGITMGLFPFSPTKDKHQYGFEIDRGW